VDRDLVVRILDAIDEIDPRLHVRRCFRQVQPPQDDPVEPLGGEHERDFVDARNVLRRHDRFFVDVAEQPDLALEILVQEAIRPAEQDVRLNTDRAQVADAVLRGLGLQLAGRADERHQCEMDIERVLATNVLAQLSDRLEVGLALDIADGAADFDEHDVDALRHRADRILDLVGDMRDDLDGAPEVLAAALLLNHREINFSRRPVVVAGRDLVGEPLVVPEVQVRFGAVVGDKHLPVLVWAHRARIDVDVGIELLECNLVAVAFEQRADRGSGESLPERRDDPAGHEDVLDGPGVCLLLHRWCPWSPGYALSA
jgi:hypothetical protein